MLIKGNHKTDKEVKGKQNRDNQIKIFIGNESLEFSKIGLKDEFRKVSRSNFFSKDFKIVLTG